MRLTFPNGEHAAVTIEQGQVGVGSASGGGTSVAIEGLAPLHAVFAAGRRGRWLTVPQGAMVVLNARPVKRIAHLRLGDLICLGPVQIRIESSETPAVAASIDPSARRRVAEDSSNTPKAALRGLSGPWFGRCVALSMPRSIGRGAGSDIRLDGPGIQERHASLDFEGGHLNVRTVSAVGTIRVNGHAVRSAVLSAGDQIEVGEHRFAIESPGVANSVSRISTPVPMRSDGARPTAMAPTPTSTPNEEERRAPRDLSGVYLLVAAAAALAAALTAFFVYAPKG